MNDEIRAIPTRRNMSRPPAPAPYTGPYIYTLGYGAGWNHDLLVATLDAKKAMLLDIRFNPQSKTPMWQRSALFDLLGPERYLHVPALGNTNYANGGPIALYAPEAGVQVVARCLEFGSVALLCGCRDVATCHRKVAAEMLSERLGVPVEHL